MADRTITERLQPSFLDRLTDEAPGETTEGRDRRVIDVRRLREIVRRDLSWLLNTTNRDDQIDAESYPNVARSTLNYGVREVTGEYSTRDRAARIRESIRHAVELYEPRVRKGTLEIVERKEENTAQSVVVFDIIADMWALPLPMELYLRSEIDVTTGQLHLEQKG